MIRAFLIIGLGTNHQVVDNDIDWSLKNSGNKPKTSILQTAEEVKTKYFHKMIEKQLKLPHSFNFNNKIIFGLFEQVYNWVQNGTGALLLSKAMWWWWWWWWIVFVVWLTFKRRCFFQRKRNYSLEFSKFYNFLLLNNNK